MPTPRSSTRDSSANSVNAYVRPIRSLVIWALDEGYLTVNPFRRFRRRAALDPLLPSEETPTKGASLDDLRALDPAEDPGFLFPSERDRRRPLGMNALSLMLTHRYHAGGGTRARPASGPRPAG